MNNYNFCILYSWMHKELKLKGCELLCYSAIFSFTHKNEESGYYGNLEQLSDLTGFSRQSITNALNSLVDKGYIDKIPQANSIINKYIAKKDVYLKFISSTNKLSKQTNNDDMVAIIDFLNEYSSKKFKYYKTYSNLIDTRMKEGFTVNDFKKVIKLKFKQWVINPQKWGDKMSIDFFTPKTLFGEKMDRYVEEAEKAGIKLEDEESDTTQEQQGYEAWYNNLSDEDKKLLEQDFVF